MTNGVARAFDDSFQPLPGSSADGATHGYLLSRGEFTSIDFPGANFTVAFGITPRGNIVGRYFSADGVGHGYLLSREERDDDEDDEIE